MKIGNFEITRIRKSVTPSIPDMQSEERFESLHGRGKRLILGTLAARSGTRWLCDIVRNHERSFAVTERDSTVESFWRYIKYNDLPIETDGIIRLLQHRAVDDWQENDSTLIFSPYFSHGLLELYHALNPEKIIFGFAPPEFVVQSFFNKKAFQEEYLYNNTDLALGYQPELANRWSHLFGRIVPGGSFFKTWEGLTRIGKLAWWINHINMVIYKQLQEIPEDRIILFDLPKADQNYEYYLDLARSLELSPLMDKEEFLSLKKLTVKKTDNVKHEWSEEERSQYETYIAEWQQVYKTLSG